MLLLSSSSHFMLLAAGVVGPALVVIAVLSNLPTTCGGYGSVVGS